jgi:biopolymer transport protein ExbD
VIKNVYDARQVDKILYLKADKTLQYEKVIDAMDIASRNGVRVLAAIADQSPGTESTVEGDVIKTP